MATIVDALRDMGTRRLVLLSMVSALAVAGLVVFMLWAQKPVQSMLYSGLSPEDAGAVIDALRERRIPYTLEGSAIYVPSDKVHELRMELASKGLPAGGGVGFEIFDRTGFGVTEFTQKVNYRRALQGELARTIAQLKEVDSARVHLALPERGVFFDEEKRARASIVVRLKPGSTLTRSHVQGIVHLVAGSVENLRPEDVTVVDTTGRMWTRPMEKEDMFGFTAIQLEYKRNLERSLEKRIQTMLEKAVGLDKVVVRVSADVDAKRVEKTEEIYDPDSQVVRSEQRSKERTSGRPASAGGVPGVLSNIPDTGSSVSAPAVTSQTQRQDEIINYEINRTVSRVIEPMNTIKRLSVAVLVDGNYEVVKAEDGTEEKRFVERGEEEIKRITELVKGAVGFLEERGDTISVVSIPFEEAPVADLEVPEAETPVVSPELISTAVRYLSVALVVIFTVLFVLRPIVKSLTAERQVLETIQQSLKPAIQSGEGHALQAGSPVQEPSMERLKQLVRENPQQAAMIIRGWLKEK